MSSSQRVARRYAAQEFQWTRSPLSYNVSGTAKRLGLIDSEAGNPHERETYFAETQKELRKKNRERYKKPRYETVPGAAPGTVAFLDYHEFPNYYDDGKNYLYLDYVSTRHDRLGQGHARKLFEGLLKKHGKDARYDFGRIAHKAVYKIFRDWESRGINVRGKNWGGFTDEEVGLKTASQRVVSRWKLSSSKPWGSDEPAHGIYDYIINRNNGKIPSSYIRHHERIAKNTLQNMERKLGIKVLDKRLRKDGYGGGWSVDMKVLEADIETASGKPMSLVWQDRWGDWYYPMMRYYEETGSKMPTGLRYGGEFHWIDKSDKARPLKASMFHAPRKTGNS